MASKGRVRTVAPFIARPLSRHSSPENTGRMLTNSRLTPETQAKRMRNALNRVFSQVAVPSETAKAPCSIKVVGVGGGGGNTVNRMIESIDEGDASVEFWAVNTDVQALCKSKAPNRIQIGPGTTRGLGAGAKPAIGRSAAVESVKAIESALSKTDMVFVTAGMGGGTGSGATPVIAEVARRAGSLTVGIVTKPFSFEGQIRMQQAVAAIEELRKQVDILIVVSNDRLLEVSPSDLPLQEAFILADNILRQGIVGISEIITKPGLINVDFADVRSVMQNAGLALMGIGRGSGKNRAQDAALAAVTSPLLDFPIQQAKGVVYTVTGNKDMSLTEVAQVSNVIQKMVGQDANVIFGALIDENMGDEMSVIVVATNFEDPEGSLGQQYARQISANGLHLCLCVVVVGATGGGSCSSGRRR
uniref:Cell division protein FtsZ n=1 Tax=Lotharella globosa TaxID=91324 RepID=A0A7S4DM17_9EUKA